MNTSLHPGKVSLQRRGIALVSVLVLVVLLTAVIISFWATSTLEYSASRSYKATSSARMMADAAVNLAQSQINEATSQGINYAWASQPGAIRVFDTSGATAKIYKLYSAQYLTATPTGAFTISAMNNGTTTPVATGEGPVHSDMPPANWSTYKALWIDLNAPANDASGAAHFPIFNEKNASTVDGFSINGTVAGSLGVVTGAAGTATIQQAPMPVRWLYVLQNGQIIAPDPFGGSSTATVATFSTAPAQPAANNPIVGRIAFWTDDETCKVNINTAGGGGVGAVTGATSPPTIDPTNIANATFWDLPHFTTYDDYFSLAESQPATGEFQRYPGHPATVALENVLSGLFPTTTLTSTLFYGPLTPASPWGLLPRYQNGGSQGGTATDAYTGNSAAIPLKASPQNHLYASVAEMLFTNGRNASAINGLTATTQQQIETARFFLTAHSRAPELTLFGQPRVSMWPEMVTKNELPGGDPLSRPRSAIDKLLAFCATTNSGTTTSTTGEYYFSRYDPTSCSADITLSRNVTLLQYLDYFTSQPTPGYGPAMASYTSTFPLSFDNKYGQLGMRQILTEIFDYIRTVNIADSTMTTPVTQDYAQTWITPTTTFGYRPGLFQVAPSLGDAVPNNVGTVSSLGWHTQGFGIYPRLSEVAVQFVAMGQGASPIIPSQGASQPANTPPLTMALPALTGVPMNSVYGTTTVKTIGVSGPEIFGNGDLGTNPFRSADPNQLDVNNPALNPTYPTPCPTPGTVPPYPGPTSTVNPLANPYMTDNAWNAAGYNTTIQDVTSDVNTMVQDKRQYYDPAANPKHANPNYLKWYAPGNTHSITGVAGTPVTGRLIQAFFLLNFITPAQMIVNNGVENERIRPALWVRIQGLNSLQVNGHVLGFPADATMLYGGNQDQSDWASINFPTMLWGRHTGTTPPGAGDLWQSLNPFYSQIIPVALNWPTDVWPSSPTPVANQINFTAGQLTITLYDGGGLNSGYYASDTAPPPTTGPNALQVIQTYTVYFGDNATSTFTMPTYPPQIPDPFTYSYPGPIPVTDPTDSHNPSYNAISPYYAGHPNESLWYPETWPSSLNPQYPLPTLIQSVGINQTSSPVPFYTCTSGNPIPPFSPPSLTIFTPGTNEGDRWAAPYLASTSFPWGNGIPGYVLYINNDPGWALIENGDVVQSMVLGSASSASLSSQWTDARMLATGNVPGTAFSENPNWGLRPLAHNLLWDDFPWCSPNPTNPLSYPTIGGANGHATYWNPNSLFAWQSYGNLPLFPPTLSAGIPNLSVSGNANTDWDNGLGFLPDGPFINKADEGSLAPTQPPPPPGAGNIAYFIPWASAPAGPAFYSANREVPSPGMLGSLSTGVDPSAANPSPTPWQTLLFRPYPNTTTTATVVDHPGAKSPMDHLLLDLFWMPVAEPYAISEPFSTGGKINLNYQIEPFTYITRSTAIRAVLNTQKVAQISSTGTQSTEGSYYQPNGINYKLWYVAGGRGIDPTWNARFPLDVNMTLTQFDDKFNGTNNSLTNPTTTPDIFHSASQICEMYLVPKVTPAESNVGGAGGFAAHWYNGINYGLIGDNTRERPYANVYGVLTTKSNTFTVYYRVQSLKNANTDQTKWDENQGAVLGEYRGSTILERYIDPNQTIPDFAATAAAADIGGPAPQATLDGGGGFTSYYRWRIVDNHQFAP